MGSNCCKGDAGGRPIRSNSSIYSRSRAGASLDERFTASDDPAGIRLTVSSARTGDTDVYTLQASNAAGSDSTRVRVEVAADEAPTGEDPPAFLRRLQDLTVKVGTRTRFLVEIVSSTECKVTWYRNERRLLEAERVALARDGNFWCADVAAVSVDDAGRWTCTAENAGGRASCSAHLNVLVPKAYKRPEFVEELRALLTEQGTVSLECKVVGVPTPLLRWFKDSREIKAGDVFALTANAEDPTSLGTYTCEAVNCMGRAYSSSKVHVVGRGSREGSARPPSSSVTPEPPPIFTKELEDQFVRICEPLTLGCHVVVPPWPRSVVWYNKEGKVEPNERYHVLEDGAGGYLLELASAEWPDEGEWKCVATSSGGRVGISTCYVTMDVPKNYRKPRFMENLQAVLTEEGLVSFECKVVGFPTPVLSWFKDGQELKPGDVYQLTGTNSLGSYCCIARNCMGQASSSAELTVEDIQNQLNEEEKLQLFSKNQAPKFIQGLKSVEAKIDEPFRFTIKVAIPPEPSVLWYRDDQPVDESSRCHHGREERGVFYLDIQSLEFLDQAEWKCVAMNDFGHSVTSCFLKLIIPRHYKKPRFLENLQAILSDEGAVNLECKVIGVPQPVLKWYKDGEELKPGDIHRIISGQDGTCCLGTYTCEAQNCMGIAASSASLLGFDDSMKAKKKKAEEQALQRNLSLSTIHEERTSQMYDTPVGDVTTLDDKGEISFSFDGKEVSVSLYETPDLTEEEALQIVEMYADQLSENITEHNVVELPPLRFVKETSTSGNLLMEAVIIDVSPDYFVTPDEDMRTEADIEDISIADENGPPQLSLDQDIEIGGEDYLEKTMALLSEEKSDLPLKFSRKKSDSQRSADDFFSLSRDPSISEDIKRDDDTQAESFASAHSLGKPKSKSSKPSGEDGQESSEPTKTIVFKDEALKHSLDSEVAPVIKPKRERRTSRSSRRSSSGSEKSISKLKEEVLVKKESVEVEIHKKPQMTENDFKENMVHISTSLSKVINDVQIIERDIILKSELMTSAATASRSLEIISSLISPLTEIHSITDAAREAASESKEVSSTLFNNLPQPLKALQRSLTLIEKCIDMESDSRTLVKKTCVAFVETCGSEMQQLLSNINTVISKNYLLTDDKVLSEIQSVNNEMCTVMKFSSETIKARNLLSEASEIKVEEPSVEVKHLRDTQKAVFELKSPLNSLLSIVESADSGKNIDVAKVRNSEVILNDMSGSIQDLQTALEQIETLSVKESTLTLHKYNTEIIETVMESVVKLRNSFEQLSTESRSEDKDVLKQAVASIKENLHKISSQIEVFEGNVGTFDVLQSENKLDALQKMAQILIALENNLPRLDSLPEVKNHMTLFHKNLTKVLENVIESNESKKYFILMGICDAVNIINASIKNLDVDSVLALASLNNSLRIIQDQFITNVFDSELNCFILTNIADTLVGIQEAINSAEETSIQIDSEHIQELPPQELKESKAKVVMEHIDHAIAAIVNLKTLESTQELKLRVTPTLENICPVLEELKRSVASIKASGIEEEHISDISDLSSFAQTLASPLCELNQNIIVLNQQIVENIESMKENSEIMATVAEPLHELNTTLEILQHEVISQYDEDLTPYDISINMASAVQNLHSCIVMIQEQAGVEAVDDMSTLEDISGIKTTADTTASDRLLLPAAIETAIEPDISVLNVEQQTTATAQALQTLNEHITILQTPEIIDALDTLSEVSDYSSLKSFVVGLGELHSGIEEVLHPLLMEGSDEIGNLINPSKLTAIAEPMQEIQQSLSVLDTSNIPIYENILEMPTEKIHSVIQNLSEFKKHVDKCMLAVFPAMHNADNTVEIANKVGAIREVCENLKEIIETTKADEGTPIPKEVSALEVTVDNLLDATDVSKGIKIDQVKTITEELYEKITIVQEEIIQFTPHASEKLAREAKLIQTIDELQNNIAVLEQYDFVDLSRASDLSCTSPQMAVELESDSLLLMEDIVDSAVSVVQDSTQETPVADLMIVEDFFKTCKNEFTILRCLITKATTHKKIIRLLQEFSSLQSTINDFKNKKFELTLSEDINGCLATFLIHADDCLQNVQQSLLKIVDSQSELLIEAPLAKFENSAKVLKAAKLNKHDKQITETVNKFVEILETAKPSLQNVQAEILEEIKSTKANVVECSTLANMIEEFATFVEQEKLLSKGSNATNILEKVSSCIEKHQDYKDASGTGKTLILLKCLSDCTDVLQENLLEVKVPKPKIEEGPLKAVLTEMLEPLQALHKQLTAVQEQVLSGNDDESISIDITTTESLVQTMTEKHKEIIERIEAEEAIANEEISLILEVDKEIHSIQDSLRSIDSVQAAQMVKEIAKPVQDIEKSLCNILSSEQVTTFTEDKLPKEKAEQLVQHIDQYIELIEIVEEISAVIKIEDINETMEIAKELRECFETMTRAETSPEKATEIRENQVRLAQKLQTALSALQVQVLDSAQELAPALSPRVLQRIARVTAQLQADLVAVTGIQVALQAPIEPLEGTEAASAIESLDKQTVSITTSALAAATLESKPAILEQLGDVDVSTSIEQAIAVEQMSESTITAESTKVVTSETVVPISSELLEESASIAPQEVIAVEGSENVIMEQTGAVPIEPLKMEDSELTSTDVDQLQEVATTKALTTESVSAVVIEDFGPVLYEAAPDGEQFTYKTAELLEVPKATIDMLVLHIDEFMSDDITEVINILSDYINAEELKETISIVRELRESITASEAELKAETSDVLKEEVDLHRAQLAQKLHTALAALENVPLDTLAEMPSSNKEVIQRMTEITENLRGDLTAVTSQLEVTEQAKIIKEDEVVAEIAQIKESALEVSKATVSTPKIKEEESEIASDQTTEVIKGNVEIETQADVADFALEATIEQPGIDIQAEKVLQFKEIQPMQVGVEKVAEPISLEEVIEVSDIKTGQASQKTEEQLVEAITAEAGLFEHIQEFTSDKISNLIEEIALLTNSDELKESVELAKALKESIEFPVTEETSLMEETKAEQVQLVQKLQHSLSTLHAKALESAEEIAPAVEPDALQRVSEIITYLQDDLNTAMVSGLPTVHKAAEIVQSPDEENSMKQLEELLQKVTDKINLPTDRDTDDTEDLKDTLDEVQTVIIKLKRDYDGAMNDTLNETLEDLECSVRSVQLQINEDSPPELLKEACATLQLLVNNMNETQEVRDAETITVQVPNENILENCSAETESTVTLLEEASKISVTDSNLAGIVSSLNSIRNTVKFLKLSFEGNADALIEHGVDVVHNLDQLEDKVFSLEKDLLEANLTTEMRDTILTAVHSVYGSISNMRGTISSIQKRYMFEHYGNPSETLLRSIKNINVILEIDSSEKQAWKKFSKSLRKVLNHFEDIKFYINLDKTARLPSDAAFTKIILEELKSNICEVMIPQASLLGEEATTKINILLDCVNRNLTNIESKLTLEVKEKIPIFKDLAVQILDVTDFLKIEKGKMIEKLKEVSDLQEKVILESLELTESSIQIATQDEARETDLNEEVKDLQINDETTDKISQQVQEMSLEVPSTSQDSQKETVSKKKKPTKQVCIQETETDDETQIEQIASELVAEIATKAVAVVQNLKDAGYLEVAGSASEEAEELPLSTTEDEEALAALQSTDDAVKVEASEVLGITESDQIVEEKVEIETNQALLEQNVASSEEQKLEHTADTIVVEDEQAVSATISQCVESSEQMKTGEHDKLKKTVDEPNQREAPIETENKAIKEVQPKPSTSASTSGISKDISQEKEDEEKGKPEDEQESDSETKQEEKTNEPQIPEESKDSHVLTSNIVQEVESESNQEEIKLEGQKTQLEEIITNIEAESEAPKPESLEDKSEILQVSETADAAIINDQIEKDKKIEVDTQAIKVDEQQIKEDTDTSVVTTQETDKEVLDESSTSLKADEVTEIPKNEESLSLEKKAAEDQSQESTTLDKVRAIQAADEKEIEKVSDEAEVAEIAEKKKTSDKKQQQKAKEPATAESIESFNKEKSKSEIKKEKDNEQHQEETEQVGDISEIEKKIKQTDQETEDQKTTEKSEQALQSQKVQKDEKENDKLEESECLKEAMVTKIDEIEPKTQEKETQLLKKSEEREQHFGEEQKTPLEFDGAVEIEKQQHGAVEIKQEVEDTNMEHIQKQKEEELKQEKDEEQIREGEKLKDEKKRKKDEKQKQEKESSAKKDKDEADTREKEQLKSELAQQGKSVTQEEKPQNENDSRAESKTKQLDAKTQRKEEEDLSSEEKLQEEVELKQAEDDKSNKDKKEIEERETELKADNMQMKEEKKKAEYEANTKQEKDKTDKIKQVEEVQEPIEDQIKQDADAKAQKTETKESQEIKMESVEKLKIEAQQEIKQTKEEADKPDKEKLAEKNQIEQEKQKEAEDKVQAEQVEREELKSEKKWHEEQQLKEEAEAKSMTEKEQPAQEAEEKAEKVKGKEYKAKEEVEKQEKENIVAENKQKQKDQKQAEETKVQIDKEQEELEKLAAEKRQQEELRIKQEEEIKKLKENEELERLKQEKIEEEEKRNRDEKLKKALEEAEEREKEELEAEKKQKELIQAEDAKAQKERELAAMEKFEAEKKQKEETQVRQEAEAKAQKEKEELEQLEKEKIKEEKKRKKDKKLAQEAKAKAEKGEEEKGQQEKLDAENKQKERQMEEDKAQKEKAEEVEKEKLEAAKRKEEEKLIKENKDKQAKEEAGKREKEAKEKQEVEEKLKQEAEEKAKKEKEEVENKKLKAEKKSKEEARIKEEAENAALEAKELEKAKAKKEEAEKRKQEELEAEQKRVTQEEEARAKKEQEEAEEREKEKQKAEEKLKIEAKEKQEELEKLKQEAEEKAKKEKEKAENEKLKAEKKRQEETRIKEEAEKAALEAKELEEAKVKNEEAEKRKRDELEAEQKRIKQEEEGRAKKEKEEAEEREKEKLKAEKKRKKEEKLKQEQARKEKEEAEKREKEKLEVEKKQKEQEELKQAEEAKARKEREQAEREKLEAEKKRQEKLRLKQEAEDKVQKEREEAEEREMAKLKAEKQQKEEKQKQDEVKAREEKEEAEKCAKEQLEAKKKQNEQDKLKQLEEREESKARKEKVEAEEREKEKLKSEKKRKQEEKLKQEEEARAKPIKEESDKREKEELQAKKKKEEQDKIKEQEKSDKLKKEELEAAIKRKEEEQIKQEKESKDRREKTEAEKRNKAEKEAEKKRKKDEKLKQEQKEEAKKRESEKLSAEKKLQEEEKLKREEEIKLKKQKESEKLEQEKMQAKKQQLEKERLKEEKAKKEAEEEERNREEKAKEKKRLSKQRKEEEEALRKQAEEAELSRKIALKKRKDEEKARLAKEQEEADALEQKLRETERRIREERRREIEKDLNENYKNKVTTDTDSSETQFKYKKEENGFSTSHTTDEENHYIREYQYEPSRQKPDERTKFVDHNNRDYTMEFSRPSGYRERTFEHEKFTERESLGRNATIYKAQTIILDSQLRSSVPPQLDKSEGERRAQRYDRSESEKRFERHKSKALSEARSMITEKRSGVSRDLRRKPVFSTYLTDRTAVEGSRVKLTCSVLSSADPKITWYKNGVFLDNKLKYKTKFMDGLITLEVLNAVVSDSAEYTCTVENENGSVSTTANLKVYPSFEASPIPPTFTRSIRDTYHLAENELVLECRIRGQPLPTITWLKDDKPLAGNERFQAFYLADGVCRLAISSPTPDDSGKYTCKAENSVWSDQINHVVSFSGKDRCLSPNIATKERSRFNRQALESRRPHFTNVLSDYKVAQGGTIGLQVEIRGCPTRVEWLREGRSVTEVYNNARTFVEQGLYTLALSDVTEKESGMYTCRAWSTHGNVDMNAAITVVQPNELDGKPAIIVGRPEKDILISVGEDVNISFRVQGEPKPKVVFMKGIRDITTSQRVCKMTSDDYVKFTLKRSVVSDAGTYCILARNAYGCDRAFVTVVVRQRASSENLISDWTYPIEDSSISIAERKYKSVPERIPGEPSVVDGGSNWVSLAWPKPESRDAAPVLAYRVDSWLSGKDGGARWLELGITPLNSFDAFNLKQGEEYHFRVTPRNRYGWGESVQTSTPIGIGLAGDRPEFVEILPGQLKVLAGETANLSCSVKGKPLPEVIWMKNGHEVEEEGRVSTAFNGQDCSLTIRDICAEDEARYSCEAANVHGRASTYARLAVVTDRLVWEADAKLKRERSQDAEGEYPPQFTMRLRDRRVQATYPVRLTCQVVGNPPPTLTWFKDGDTLVFDSRRAKYQDEHFHTLEIAPTTLDDGGVYEAMARNSSGAVSCRCSLVVDKGIRAYVAPEFCCGLEPLYRLAEGDELRISAVVEAYPSVGVTWYRDGVRLRPSRRAIMTLDRDGQIELALAAVTARDAGVYTCTASNEVGRASTSGKVEVIEGDQPREKRSAPVVINAPDEPYSREPMFVRKPRSSEAREGDTVIIACEVIGDPKPDVYWLRDFLKPDYYRDASHFKRVGDGPEYRFEIPHAKLDYTGAYSVVARNVHGEAKAIISLQILAKDPSSTDDSHNVRYGRVEVIPRFERELTDLLSYDGDAIEFECHVTGNPEPDIRWFHYNELIRDCSDFESSFEEGAARLKIRQVTAEDEGTYSCEASNNLGKATSSACLVVYPPGEPNTLSQRLRRPPALLSAASTPRSTPRSTPARSVSRTPGPEPRRLCSPSRQMPPSFYTYPFNKVVEEGEQVTFKCAVKGLPAPWATWDKDGIILTPSARVTIKEKDELLRILEIEEVSIEDVGVYRITIENEFGRAEASARLEVITQRGKFYGGVRAYSPSPRKSLTYRRYPSVPRQD